MFETFVKLVTYYMDKQYNREDAIKLAKADMIAMFEAYFINEDVDSYNEEGDEIKVSLDEYLPGQLMIMSERKAQEEHIVKMTEDAMTEDAERAVGMPQAGQSNAVRLCDSCAHVYPECDAEHTDMKYFPNTDTIIECTKFEKKPVQPAATVEQATTSSTEQK